MPLYMLHRTKFETVEIEADSLEQAVDRSLSDQSGEWEIDDWWFTGYRIDGGNAVQIVGTEFTDLAEGRME